MDRNSFETQVNAKAEEIWMAYLNCIVTDVDNPLDFVLDYEYSSLRDAFLQFGAADSTAAKNCADAIGVGISALNGIAFDERATPMENIRDDIITWHGDAKTSFQGYLGSIENALENQSNFATVLKGLIEVQGGMIDTNHEYVLEIADMTVKALDETKEEITRRNRERIGKIVAGIGAALIVGPTGAVAAIPGRAINAAEAITVAAGAAIEVSSAESPNAVIADMYKELEKAARNMNSDRKQLAVAMAKCREYFSDSGLSALLPPKVGLAET